MRRFELDHLFVMTEPPASAMDAFVEAGFLEGAPNIHAGQGTANRRIFFDNAYVESLYLTDALEAGAEEIRRTGLLGRASRASRACPFGICVRPVIGAGGILFESWDYRPPYLPAGMSISMSTDSEDPSVPLLFSISPAHRPDQMPLERRPPLAHPNGSRTIERLRLTVPVGWTKSRSVEWMVAEQIVEIDSGPAWKLELILGGSGAQKTISATGRTFSMIPDKTRL